MNGTRLKVRARKCKVCQKTYNPRSSFQKACSPLCAVKWVQHERERKQRADKRLARERLRTRSDWTKLAQAEFNRFIKLRDSAKPCIACGTTTVRHALKGGLGWHAGHFRSTGACPELRFEPLNVHKQCVACNLHKSGNIVEYRINLVQRIGMEAVVWLEGPHEPKKYTIDELKEIRDTYRAKCKELGAAERAI